MTHAESVSDRYLRYLWAHEVIVALVRDRAIIRGMKKEPTYSAIAEWVKRRYGFYPSTSWIAHVKELNGLPLKKVAPNRQRPDSRVQLCPLNKREAIEDCFRQLGMIR